ncbi:MAG: DNA polymerase III subunit gamma/tau [Pseudomonadota bacterium]
MSYLVLARKYRPRNFEEMVGQSHVVQALSNALTQQRLHHAYLFTGTRGVGKTTVSRVLAKSLNCTGPDGQGGITAHPCGVCEACRDIDSGRFVDYVELDAASNRGVEEISQLLDQAVYKPVVGRFKVYLIDEVHMLSTTAFNAMLKTLEEPPEYLKFVLATTDPQKVPVTVLSRCLQFNLRPMPAQTVFEHLQSITQAESIAAEPAALRLLARAARGSMRDALSLTDQAIAFGGGALQEGAVRQMLGSVDRGHVLRILQALADADGAALVAAVENLRTLGLPAAGTLEELAEIAQRMAVIQAVPQAADQDDPEAGALAELAQAFAADETQLLYSIALHGRAELPLAPDEHAGLLMVLLRMLAFRGGDSGRASATAGDAGATPVRAPAQPHAAAVSESPIAERHQPVYPVSAASSGQADGDEGMPGASAPHASTEPAVPRPPTRTAGSAPTQPPAVDARPLVRPRQAAVAQMAAPSSAGPAGIEDDAPPHPAGPGSAPGRPSRTPDAGSSVPSTAPIDAAPSLTGEPVGLPANPLGERWAQLVRRMAADGLINALVRELAFQAECTGIDESADPPLWRLRVERESLRGQAHRDRLQAALSQALGQPVRLDVEAGIAQDSPARRDAAERERRQAAAEALIREDATVVALLQQFKTARIVPGSIRPV